MASLDNLIKAFDLVVGRYGQEMLRPTKQSIAIINEKLGIQLPETFVQFALESKSYSSWFASIGDDFYRCDHILPANRYISRIRRRCLGGGGRWEYVKPKHFVQINLGFDSDYDGLCKDTFDSATGEYHIQYWSPPRIIGSNIDLSFPLYLERNIRFWASLRRGRSESLALELLEK